MFMKHFLPAVLLMLSLSGMALADPMQDPIPTGTALSATKSSSISTKTASGATFQASITTGSAFPALTRNFSAAGTSQRMSLSAGASTGSDYTTHSVSAQEQMMMNFINRDRAANGLYPLALDPELSRIARIKSKDMRDNDYFAHESPTWGYARDMLRTFGYDFRGAGENIAHHATVEKAQAAFLSSPGHRRNILSAVWEKVGIGIVSDRNGYMLVTQIFAR